MLCLIHWVILLAQVFAHIILFFEALRIWRWAIILILVILIFFLHLDSDLLLLSFLIRFLLVFSNSWNDKDFSRVPKLVPFKIIREAFLGHALLKLFFSLPGDYSLTFLSLEHSLCVSWIFKCLRKALLSHWLFLIRLLASLVNRGIWLYSIFELPWYKGFLSLLICPPDHAIVNADCLIFPLQARWNSQCSQLVEINFCIVALKDPKFLPESFWLDLTDKRSIKNFSHEFMGFVVGFLDMILWKVGVEREDITLNVLNLPYLVENKAHWR